MRSKGLRIIIYDPSGAGGICHYTFQLADSLVQLGNDVTVATVEDYELKDLRKRFKLSIVFKKSWTKAFAAWLLGRIRTLNGSQSCTEPTVSEPLSAPMKSSSMFRHLKGLRLLVLDLKIALIFLLRRPDLVHFQLVNRDEDYPLIRLLKLFGLKVIYTAHDVLPHDSERPDDRKVFQKIYEAVDRIIVHSENNKNEMIRIFQIKPQKISVIAHGSNELFYVHQNISKEAARQQIGIPREKKVILFFGLIQRYKGLEYLVEAFKEVQDNSPEAVLVIAGRIHNKDPEEFKYYSQLIDQVSGRHNVICINEYFPNDKVGRYFIASDVVVLPYVKTYTSGVLLSAYAAGRPVIVTDTGGLKEVVKDGKSGFIVPPKDAKALARAIINLFESSKHVEEMGRYAKHLAETTYSWRNVALKTVDVYRSLAPSSDPSHTETALKDYRDPSPKQYPHQLL